MFSFCFVVCIVLLSLIIRGTSNFARDRRSGRSDQSWLDKIDRERTEEAYLLGRRATPNFGYFHTLREICSPRRGCKRARRLALMSDELAKLGDENSPVLDVILGQLLAFFRSLKEGLQPDSPSIDDVINRVVEGFNPHRAES
jgi:hypothetical protein